MAIDFPSSPVDGQIFTDGDHTWFYSAALPGWKLQTQTDICKAVSGTFATIVYDGTNWYVMVTNA